MTELIDPRPKPFKWPPPPEGWETDNRTLSIWKRPDDSLKVVPGYTAYIFADGRSIARVGPGTYRRKQFRELRSHGLTKAPDWGALLIEQRPFRICFRLGPFPTSDAVLVGIEFDVWMYIETDRSLDFGLMSEAEQTDISTSDLARRLEKSVSNVIESWVSRQALEKLRSGYNERTSLTNALEIELDVQLLRAKLGVEHVTALNIVCPEIERIQAIKSDTVWLKENAESTQARLEAEIVGLQTLLPLAEEVYHLRSRLEDLNRVESSPQKRPAASQLWSFPDSTSGDPNRIGNIRNKALVTDQFVYFADRNGGVHCLELTTGQPRATWQLCRLPEKVDGDLVLTDDETEQAMLMAACYNGNLYLIDSTTGNVIGSYPTPGHLRATPLVARGRVFLGCTVRDHWGGVVAFRLSDGAPAGQWTTSSNHGVQGRPVLVGKSLYFSTLNPDGETFYAAPIDQSGKATLIGKTAGPVSASPVVDEVRHLIYIACQHGFIYAFDHSGKQIWKRQLDGQVKCAGVIVGDRLYVGDDTGRLHALDLDRKGLPAWDPFSADGAIRVTPTVWHSLVAFGSIDGYVYLIDSESGQLFGKYFTHGNIVASPVITQDGSVIIGCDQGSSGRLYALNWHLGQFEKAAKYAEMHQQWNLAGNTWLQAGDRVAAIRCYQAGRMYEAAAVTAVCHGDFGTAAANFERAARQAPLKDRQVSLLQQALSYWNRLRRGSEAHSCQEDIARLQNAPLLVLTPATHTYQVPLKTDIALDFWVENAGFSLARQIVIRITGDVAHSCASQAVEFLDVDDRQFLQVAGILPTTQGEFGGVASVNARATFCDEHGNMHHSTAVMLQIRVN